MKHEMLSVKIKNSKYYHYGKTNLYFKYLILYLKSLVNKINNEI